MSALGRPCRRTGRRWPLLALLFLSALPLAAAEEGPGAPRTDPPLETLEEALPPRPPVPAEAAEELPEVPVPSEQAVRYYRTGNRWWWVGLFWALAVPLLVVVTGLAARWRDLGMRWTGNRPALAVIVVFTFYALFEFVVDLPLGYVAGFLRQHAYGLSNQPLATWLGDRGKGLALGIAGGAATLWLPWLLLARAPRTWWLWTALAALPFTLFVTFVSPIWIAPLFDDFGRMEDRALEERILALADRVGVEADRVWEVDKSVDTNRVNAYVTGFLGTQRIVLWDTLLARLDDDEVLFVMAHELGHFVLGHIVRGVLLGTAGLLLGLLVLDRLTRRVVRRRGERWGICSLADPASLPLFLLLFNVLGIFATPVALAASRWQEHEADRFALELTHDNRACAGAFVELQTTNLSYPFPGPLYRLFRSSHPPIGERIQFCGGYRPWEEGEDLRYREVVGGP